MNQTNSQKTKRNSGAKTSKIAAAIIIGLAVCVLLVLLLQRNRKAVLTSDVVSAIRNKQSVAGLTATRHALAKENDVKVPEKAPVTSAKTAAAVPGASSMTIPLEDAEINAMILNKLTSTELVIDRNFPPDPDITELGNGKIVAYMHFKIMPLEGIDLPDAVKEEDAKTLEEEKAKLVSAANQVADIVIPTDVLVGPFYNEEDMNRFAAGLRTYVIVFDAKKTSIMASNKFGRVIRVKDPSSIGSKSSPPLKWESKANEEYAKRVNTIRAHNWAAGMVQGHAKNLRDATLINGKALSCLKETWEESKRAKGPDEEMGFK